MDDLISRQVAIEAIENVEWYHINQNGELVSGANSQEHEPLYKAADIYAAINEQPSADVVEVVRCKDCKYGMSYEPIFVFCQLLKIKVNEEGFCYLGGRETDAKIY